MRSVEAEGETIDEAIASALRTLAVERDRVEVEILADAARGLFGFGGRRARVRATLRPSLAEQLLAKSSVPRETSVREPAGSPGPATTPRRVLPEAPSRAPSPQTRLSAAEEKEIGARACSLLAELLDRLGMTASVEVGADGDAEPIRLEVSGEHAGLLIGRRGQTLDALEYLLNRMIGRDDGPGAGRVVIDVERYRQRRREYLEALAHRLADKVLHTGRTVTLNPMNPRDRRIVHITLQGMPGVNTKSQGEGHFRQMLIIPADPTRRRPRAEGGEG